MPHTPGTSCHFEDAMSHEETSMSVTVNWTVVTASHTLRKCLSTLTGTAGSDDAVGALKYSCGVSQPLPVARVTVNVTLRWATTRPEYVNVP